MCAQKKIFWKIDAVFFIRQVSILRQKYFFFQWTLFRRLNVILKMSLTRSQNGWNRRNVAGEDHLQKRLSGLHHLPHSERLAHQRKKGGDTSGPTKISILKRRTRTWRRCLTPRAAQFTNTSRRNNWASTQRGLRQQLALLVQHRHYNVALHAAALDAVAVLLIIVPWACIHAPCGG